jgi:hypothetical protein
MTAVLDPTIEVDPWGSQFVYDGKGATFDEPSGVAAGLRCMHAGHSVWGFVGASVRRVLIGAGPVMKVVPLRSDDGEVITMIERTTEYGAGSPTLASDDATYTAPSPTVTIHVDDAAPDDTGDGTIGDPFKTVAAAIAAVKSGMGSGQVGMLLCQGGEAFSVGAIWSFEENGLLIVDSYGTGRAAWNLTGDTTVFSGIGRYSSSANLTLHFGGIDVVGVSSTTTNSPFANTDGPFGAATPIAQAHIFRDCSFTDVGGIFVQAPFPAWSEADGETVSSFLALENVGCADFGDYGLYLSSGGKYLSLHTTVASGGTDTGHGFIRCYRPKGLMIMETSASSCAVVPIRILPAAGSTFTAQWWGISGLRVWNSPYLLSAEAQDSEDPPSAEEPLDHVWLFGCTSAPTGSGGTGARFGGTREGIAERCCFNYGASTVLENEANNPQAHEVIVQNRTAFNNVGGSDTFGVISSTADLTLYYENNYQYLTGTGTNNHNSCAGSPASATTVLSSTNNIVRRAAGGPSANNWYDGWDDEGNLAAWNAGSGHDGSPSADDSSSTHGLVDITSAGSGGSGSSPDFDLHHDGTGPYVGTGKAIVAAFIDIDGNLRVTTHDAGAHDVAATDPPTAPSLGGDPEPMSGESTITLGALGLEAAGEGPEPMSGVAAITLGDVEVTATGSDGSSMGTSGQSSNSLHWLKRYGLLPGS